MNRAVIILLGLLALAFLFFVCIYNKAPAIQTDIQARASAVLSKSSMDWATVRTDGRIIILNGIAPSEALRQQVVEKLGEVSGVVEVNDQMTIARSVMPSAPSTPDPAISLKKSPFESKFTKNSSGIVLSGSVPSHDQQQELLNLAEDKFGVDNVTNQLVIGTGASEDWYQTATIALKNLALLNNGAVIEITDNQVKIKGQVINDDAKKMLVENLSNEMPESFAIDLNLSEPEVAVLEKQEPEVYQALTLSSCREQFNQLVFSTQTINFSTDSADIEPQASIVLDNLLKFATLCPYSIIEVSGHSDSRGDDAHNYLLSKQRAQAVARYLIKKGIQPENLQVESYGETRPLADNNTEQGQANNRRIELKYLREGK